MIGKRTKAARANVDRNTPVTIAEAVKLLKENATAKFDETIEVSLNLNVDPRHADQMVRGVVKLPNGTGKNVRVAVFARDAKADEAKAAGADIVGAEDLMEHIQKGNFDFDRVIASPDMMGIVGRLGKVLGPKGMMPNPRVGTVTPNLAQAIEDAKGGAVQFRVEKAGVIHAGVGKASFSQEALEENLNTFLGAVSKARPSGAKGVFVQSIHAASTMGPGLQIKTSELGD